MIETIDPVDLKKYKPRKALYKDLVPMNLSEVFEFENPEKQEEEEESQDLK